MSKRVKKSGHDKRMLPTAVGRGVRMPRKPFERRKLSLAASLSILRSRLLNMSDHAKLLARDIRDIERKINWLLTHCEPERR